MLAEAATARQRPPRPRQDEFMDPASQRGDQTQMIELNSTARPALHRPGRGARRALDGPFCFPDEARVKSERGRGIHLSPGFL